MKKLFLIPLILVFGSVVTGQKPTQNARRIRSGTAVPTMNCSPGPSYTDFYLRTTTDVLYYCAAAPSTWSVFSTAGGGATAWGTITGTLSDQTDLQSALDLKANLVSPTFTTPTLGVASATSLNTGLINPTGHLLEQRNGANAQTFRVYNTYTDASNYSRLGITTGSGFITILGEKAGTGTDSDVYFRSGTGKTLFLGAGATNFWRINTSGHFIADGDNVSDIGTSGALRPRTGYFGTSVVSTAYKTTTNCADSAGAAACSAAAAGAVVVDAGATSVVVSTTAVTSTSRIFVQEDSSLSTELGVTCNTSIVRSYQVTARTAGTSFTVTSSAAPTTNPACLSYSIIN